MMWTALRCGFDSAEPDLTHSPILSPFDCLPKQALRAGRERQRDLPRI